jgi:hypothetical protein
MSVFRFRGLFGCCLILSGATVISDLRGPIETIVPFVIAYSNDGIRWQEWGGEQCMFDGLRVRLE